MNKDKSLPACCARHMHNVMKQTLLTIPIFLSVIRQLTFRETDAADGILLREQKSNVTGVRVVEVVALECYRYGRASKETVLQTETVNR